MFNSIWTGQGEGPFVSSSKSILVEMLSVSVLLSWAQHALALLHMLKILCPFYRGQALNSDMETK